MTTAFPRFPLNLVALAAGLTLGPPMLTAAHAQAAERPAQSPSRCESDWVVRPLPAHASKHAYAGTRFLGSPSAARVRSGLYTVGMIPTPPAAGSEGSAALFIGPDGTTLPLPVGSERGEAFRIAVAEPDSLYLLWAVAPPATDTAQPPRRSFPTEVWFSARTRDTGWTIPTRIFTALRISWNDAEVPEVVGDRNGVFHLVFSAMHEWGNTTFVHVTMQGGRAHVATMKMRGAAGYMSAAPTSTGLLIAFVAADVQKTHNANSVFVIDADETGFHPPARMVMSSPGKEQAISLRAVATDEGIHLVWIERRGADGESLRHTVSHDGGRQWSPWSDAPYAGVPHITAMPAGRDGVSVFYTVLAPSDASYSEVMCWSGDWMGPVRLGGALRLHDPHPVTGSATRPSIVAMALSATTPQPTVRLTWLEPVAAPPCASGRSATPCRK